MNQKPIEVITGTAPSEIRQLLQSYDLDISDLDENVVELFAYMHHKTLVGVIGIERYQTIGLLRSLAVDREFQQQGIGEQLVSFLIQHCKANNILELFLLTTTADQYFKKHGFVAVNRQAVPREIKLTSQFADLCPVSAVVMKRKV